MTRAAVPSEPERSVAVEPDRAAGAPVTAQTVVRRRRRTPPGVLAAVSLGGALGASARYGVAQLVPVTAGSFPWATFLTNVTASFAVGLVLVVVLERFPPNRYLRPFLGTGLIGAYSTYSTFAVETDLLIKDSHATLAAGYAIATLLAGLVGVWAGMRCGRALPLPTRGETS